jgi:hypothetical protein
LSTHLRFGRRSGFFPSGFPTDILYAFLRLHKNCRLTQYFLIPAVVLS